MRKGGVAMAMGLAMACAPAAAAQGGPPMLTDDPGTPGNGNWEINVAVTSELTRAEHDFETPLLDVNYGLGEHLQLKVEGPWAIEHPVGGPTRTRVNTIAPGVKWRFVDQGPRSPVDVSTFPAIELNRDGPPEYVLPLEVAREFGKFAANADAGATWSGRRPDAWFYGLALGFSPSNLTDVVGEVHSVVARDGSGAERLLNFGLRQQAFGLLLMASAGHSISEPAGEPAKTVAYLGFSYQTARRREPHHD
jgi:hypothetical protein